MIEDLDMLENLLFDIAYPLKASEIIINLLKNEEDAEWTIWRINQAPNSYENHKSLLYTLNLLNTQMNKIRKIYHWKLQKRYKSGNI